MKQHFPLNARLPVGEARDKARDVGALLAEGIRRLKDEKVPEPEASAEFLMAAALGIGRGGLNAALEQALDERRRHHFRQMVGRRCRRLPLGYILGTQPFMGMELRVTSDVLIPRPETEELALAAAGLVRRLDTGGRPPTLVDVGTGSGCIALGLARLVPEALVVATDISPAALAVASENVRRQGLEGRVRVIREDLFKPARDHRGWADLLASNPPYIPTGRLGRLSPELAWEPRMALDGGPDGLMAIRAVIRQASQVLRRGGWLAIEIDEDQGAEARRLMAAAGFRDPEVRRDGRGLERVALGMLG